MSCSLNRRPFRLERFSAGVVSAADAFIFSSIRSVVGTDQAGRPAPNPSFRMCPSARPGWQAEKGFSADREKQRRLPAQGTWPREARDRLSAGRRETGQVPFKPKTGTAP
jgi:hypothetical protein